MVDINECIGTEILLSGFGDEASKKQLVKDPDDFIKTMMELQIPGLTHRFVDGGDEANITNSRVARWVQEIAQKTREKYGRQIFCSGTAVGKSKLLDYDDANKKAKFMPEAEMLDHAKRVSENTAHLGAPLARGFTFYNEAGKDFTHSDFQMALDYTGKVAEIFKANHQLYGIENEAGLAVHDANSMIRFITALRQSGLENVVGILDLGNFNALGLDPVAEALKVIEHEPILIVGFHAKANSMRVAGGVTAAQEHLVENYVPIGQDTNGTNYHGFLEPFADKLPAINEYIAGLRGQGYPLLGTLGDLEPHVKGAGQFGGYSGPDGMEEARDGLLGGYRMFGISCVRG